METPSTEPKSPISPVASRYTGKVVYIYAYDVAYDMQRRPLTELLGQPVSGFGVGVTKRSPRRALFYRPQMVRLPVMECSGSGGPVRLEPTVKLFPVGAISIAVSVPFSVNRLEELAAFHDPQFQGGTMADKIRDLAEQVRGALGPYCVRPVEEVVEGEAYTVFCMESSGAKAGDTDYGAEKWLEDHRRQIASLLTEEPDISLLSDQEVEESTSRYLSYYGHDLAVLDWDAALLIDEPENFEVILHILELANVQLEELEAYDRILDAALDRSYRDLGAAAPRGSRGVHRSLREIRVDLARLNDELSNATKFFGDWHFARLYQAISGRFHLDDWQRVIADKLRTLDGLYQILNQDRVNRWMIVLEATIVLLILVDMFLLFFGLRW
ncbi:MAG TPA: hypothetical protein VM098_08210 [Phycisphaerae bacterium]|nr:hypothetical protein [Phycisphaerae bacterium]